VQTIQAQTTIKKSKTLKSLTLPQLIAQELEQLAKTSGCKQADIVKVAICEFKKLTDDERSKLLVEYQVY